MIQTVNTSTWTHPFSTQEQRSAMTALEEGQVLFFPNLGFELLKYETLFLNPTALQGNSKNISFIRNLNDKRLENKSNPKLTMTEASTNKKASEIDQENRGIVKGSRYQGAEYQNLLKMLSRFVSSAEQLILALFPDYVPHLIQGRTSFRPIEVLGRKNSLLKDDTRLHVDAFPSSPNHGRRILRVFSNINPSGKSRIWNLGEPFETVLEKFAHVFRKPWPGSRLLLSWLNITKSYRSLYDHYMLQLHDSMKKNDHYQNTVEKLTHHFPSGSTWIVMTDTVSHAALSGQYMLEHTFYLPVRGMQTPEKSPLSILEKRLGESLGCYF